MEPEYKSRTPRFSTSKQAPPRHVQRNAPQVNSRSADELMALCEWRFRFRPLALKLARQLYAECQRNLMVALGARK